MAEAIKEGIEAAGGKADILQYVTAMLSHAHPPLMSPFRVPETLPEEVLTKMHAPPKRNYPILTLQNFVEYDGWLFGIPTRYGSMPTQWKVYPTIVSRCFSSRIDLYLSSHSGIQPGGSGKPESYSGSTLRPSRRLLVLAEDRKPLLSRP